MYNQISQSRRQNKILDSLANLVPIVNRYSSSPWNGALQPFLASIAPGLLKQAEQLFSKQACLWSDDEDVQGKIMQRLGWLEAPWNSQKTAQRLETWAGRMGENGFSHVVLIGMGGSSLAPEVFRDCFGSHPGSFSLDVLDTTSPDAVSNLEQQIALERTLFVVASKSGTTIETDALYRYFKSRVAQLKDGQARDHFVAITDPGTPLDTSPLKENFSHIFHAPADVGGRFSALTPFGLVPASLLGINLGPLINPAIKVIEGGAIIDQRRDQNGIVLGGLLGHLALQKKSVLTLLLPTSLRPLGVWIEQLVCESTGKKGKGILVVQNEPEYPADHYPDDRLFVSITLEEDSPELKEKVTALKSLGHPIIERTVKSLYHLGAEMVAWQIATALAGAILGVNPFDEPNVAEAKQATTNRLNNINTLTDNVRSGDVTPLSLLQKEDNTLDLSLAGFIEKAKSTQYLALLAYVPPSKEIYSSLIALQTTLGRKLGSAVTLGIGPRYLHSTGQLHKGGAKEGCFMLLFADPQSDLSIPERAYTLKELHLSQALGDYDALKGHQRSVLGLRLYGDLQQALDQLSSKLGERGI